MVAKCKWIEWSYEWTIALGMIVFIVLTIYYAVYVGPYASDSCACVGAKSKDYQAGQLNGLNRADNLWKQSIREDMDKCEVTRSWLSGAFPGKINTMPCKDAEIFHKCPAFQRDARRIKEKD